MKFGIQLPMWETPTDGSGGGSGNPGAGGAGATGTGTTGATGTGDGTAAGGTGTGQGTVTPGVTQPAAKQFAYQEDRSDWIPRHRFNEVNQQAQRTRQLEQQLQDSQRRIQALAGVNPTNPADAEADSVRTAFKQMFPKLGALTDAHIDRLMQLADNSEQITETTNAYWQNVGQHMVSEVSGGVAEALGMDELTPTQARRVAQAYTSWLHDDLMDARRKGTAPTLLPRHEQRDPKLITEFVKAFTDDFVEPVRRRSVQANVERVSRRVPSGRAATQAGITTKPKIDFTNEQAVEDAAVEAFRAHGGGFRR